MFGCSPSSHTACSNLNNCDDCSSGKTCTTCTTASNTYPLEGTCTSLSLRPHLQNATSPTAQRATAKRDAVTCARMRFTLATESASPATHTARSATERSASAASTRGTPSRASAWSARHSRTALSATTQRCIARSVLMPASPQRTALAQPVPSATVSSVQLTPVSVRRASRGITSSQRRTVRGATTAAPTATVMTGRASSALSGSTSTERGAPPARPSARRVQARRSVPSVPVGFISPASSANVLHSPTLTRSVHGLWGELRDVHRRGVSNVPGEDRRYAVRRLRPHRAPHDHQHMQRSLALSD